MACMCPVLDRQPVCLIFHITSGKGYLNGWMDGYRVQNLKILSIPVVLLNINSQYSFFYCLGIRAYEQLGLRAFGHPGKIIAAVIITLHNVGGK